MTMIPEQSQQISELLATADSTTNLRMPRSYWIDQKRILKELEEFLGLEYISQEKIGPYYIFLINRARIVDTARFFKKNHYLLDGIFALDNNDNFDITYAYHLRPYKQNSIILIQTKIDKSIQVPSIRKIYQNSLFFEQDITKRLGIEFIPLLPPSQVLTVPIKIHYPVKFPNELRTGIFHPVHKSNYYIHIDHEDGIVQTVELQDGWLYNYTQPKLEHGSPINEALGILLETTSFSPVHLNLAYYRAIEEILNISLTTKVKYLRILALEFERIRSYLIWFIQLAEILDFRKIEKALFKYLKRLDLIYTEFFGTINMENAILLGSVMDVNTTSALHAYHYFRDYIMNMWDLLEEMVYHSSTQDKTRNIGKISKDEAIKLGLTGPNSRASGVAIDIRATDPYLSYITSELSQIWSIVSFSNGDTFSRIQVRLWELKESISICKEILKNLSIYQRPVPSPKIPKNTELPPKKQAYIKVEAPQGALSIYLRTNIKKSERKLDSVRILPADLINFNILASHLLIGEEIRNIPLITHSLHLDFNLLDR